MTDLLSGKGPGQRKEIFYFDDSGSLNAFRYGDWKVTFATKDSWWADVAKPRTVPLVINLRQDPFEMAQDSPMYTRWYADKLWVMVPAQAIVGRFLMSFKDFPPRQTSEAPCVGQSVLYDSAHGTIRCPKICRGISLQIECTPYFAPLLLVIADEVIE